MRTAIDRLTVEQGTPVDSVIAVLRPDDEEIASWLRSLRVPLGEPVQIRYDHLGPTRIETKTMGTWRLPETDEERDRGGIHIIAIEGRSLGRFDETDLERFQREWFGQ